MGCLEHTRGLGPTANEILEVLRVGKLSYAQRRSSQCSESFKVKSKVPGKQRLITGWEATVARLFWL